MGLGDCKCCIQYKAQVVYLQGLLDRTLAQIAPVPEKEAPQETAKETEIYGNP